jgi:hypothetical protein
MQRLFVIHSQLHANALFAFVRANYEAMADEGRPMAVLVTEYRAKRNTQQNKLLWAVLNQIADEAWVGGKQFSAEAWHEFFKRKFIGCNELPNGQTLGISTTTLDIAAFAEYVTQIQAYAGTELGIELT